MRKHKFGHIHIVANVTRKKSPCCNVDGIDKAIDEVDGITEFKTFCSKCGQEFNSLEVEVCENT